MAPPAAAVADADLEKVVGRGAALLTLSKFWFLASGFVIQSALQSIMARGVTEDEGKGLYGLYAVATSFAGIFNAVVYQGTTQAVATFTGRDPSRATAVRRAAFRLQATFAGALFLLLFFGAPIIADVWHKNPNVGAPLRIASVIFLAYAFYAVPMGSFTGRRLYVRQAAVDLTYSTLKVALIAGFALFAGGLFGGKPEAGVAGFAAASLCVLGMSLAMTRKPGPIDDAPDVAAGKPPIRAADLFRFQILTMLFSGGVAFITLGDLQLVNLLFDRPELSAAAVAELKERLSGEYQAARLFSAIPYQAVFAITFVIFPLVSGLAAGETEKLRLYVRRVTKYALIIATMIATCFAAAPGRAITLLYRPEYEAGAAPALRILVLGYVAFSVFFIMLSVVTASGRPQASVLLVGLIVAVQAPLAALLIGRDAQVPAAVATAAAMVVGWIAMQVYHRRRWGAGLDLGVAARTLVAGALAGAIPHLLLDRATFLGRPGFLAHVGYSMNANGVLAPTLVAKGLTVAIFAVASAAFLALLAAFGVLDADDRARFARLIGRGKKPSA